MGAWGTGVFENDTALDTIAEMSVLIERYYKGLLDSEDEHNIMLAGFIYLAVTAKDNAGVIEEWTKGEADQLLRHEIVFVVKGLQLANIGQYKYKLIGNLYKCIDKVNDWTDDCKASRKAAVQNMIDLIAKED